MRVFLFLALSVAAWAPVADGAIPLGVYGNHASFDRLTGQRTQSEAIFIGWDQGRTWGKPYSYFLGTLGDTPHIALKTERAGGAPGLSPRNIALGRGDAHLIGLAQAIATSGKPVIVRPFPEMNNYDNDYAAFNSNGRRRDASRSTLWNKRAFQRVYILMHGGTAAFMSAKLRARKMPGVAVDLPPNPYPNMTVVWNPLGIGEPPVAGNGYRDYYPGGAYHDAYGNNYYNTTGTYAWHVTTSLYRAFPSKPFMFPGPDPRRPGLRQVVRHVRAPAPARALRELLQRKPGERVRPAPEAEEPGCVSALRRAARPLDDWRPDFYNGKIAA